MRFFLGRTSIMEGGYRISKCRKFLGRFKATVHVPRRPYVKALPGIPTIRVFEALACGIPLDLFPLG